MKYIIFLSLFVVFVAVHAKSVDEKETIDALQPVDRSECDPLTADISSEESDTACGRFADSYYDDTGMEVLHPTEQDARANGKVDVPCVFKALGAGLKCSFSEINLIKIVKCFIEAGRQLVACFKKPTFEYPKLLMGE